MSKKTDTICKVAELKEHIEKLESDFKSDVYVNGNKEVVMSLNAKIKIEKTVRKLVRGIDELTKDMETTTV